MAIHVQRYVRDAATSAEWPSTGRSSSSSTAVKETTPPLTHSTQRTALVGYTVHPHITYHQDK